MSIPTAHTPNTLVTLKNLVNDGRPTFGVFNRVEKINYLDYYSYLLSKKPVSQWRKKLRANQFCFIQITQTPYRLCFAVATLNWATSSFCYLHDEENDTFEVVEALQPFTRRCKFNQSTYSGDIIFQSSALTIKLQFSESAITVNVDSKIVVLSAKLVRAYAPLSVCTPTGKTGWTYTQKEPVTDISGTLKTLLAPSENIELTSATAMLDWSLGYMRRVTNWFWACISAILADGKQFALNLATGVNESGASENICWIDGERFHLPAVHFCRGETPQATWAIYHQKLDWSNVALELSFTPIRCYQKKDRLFIVDSIFEQWIGHYSGNIELGGKRLAIDNIIGLAEDHYAKW